MSTKTTFKRVALVAVASLGFGLLSVAPSSAATQLASDIVTVVSPSVSTSITTPVTSVVKLTGVCQGAYTHNEDYSVQNNIGAWQVLLQSVPDGITSYEAPTLTVRASDGAYPYLNAPVMVQAGEGDPSAVAMKCASSGVEIGYATVSFNPAAAGTYTFLIKGVFQAYASASWTVTVAAKATANSTSTTAVTTAVAPGTGSDATAIFAPKAATGDHIATILVTPNNGIALGSAGALVNSDAKIKAATISGPGLLSFDGGTTKGRYVTSTSGTLAQTLRVYGDGTAGVATITITDSLGQFTKTKTVTFVGSTASIKEDADNSPTKAIIGIGAGQEGEVSFLGYDSNGNLSEAAPAAIDYGVSSDTSIATVSSAANGTLTVRGVKAGKVTITACNTSLCVGATISATTTVVVGNGTLASVTLTWDKAEYAPGEKMVLTVSGKDSTGGLLADGGYDLFAASPTSNVQLLSTSTGNTWTVPSADSITLVGGVKTYSVYAPLSAGTVTVAGTVSLTGNAAVSATASVVNPALDAANAATDAAAEATDAANAATDAANAAAEAADAATAAAQDAADAVAALSTQVATLISGLKAQLTALTNLVIKIQKKVKA